jgi:RHS repeat-associated protein
VVGASGTVRYAPAGTTAAAAVLEYAQEHFFRPRRFVDAFAAAAGADYGTEVEYDRHDLLPVQTTDAAGNRITAGERNSADERTGLALDYRVLAPTLVSDANRNRVAVAYDALGRVTATAVMGKPEDDTGDRITGLTLDPTAAQLRAFWADPLQPAPSAGVAGASAAELLGSATTRLLYDQHAVADSPDAEHPWPSSLATLTRELHVATPGATTGRLLIAFGYSDGFGHEVQRRVMAEPEPAAGGAPAAARWACTGWVVLDNKGRAVRTYEPFFTATHRFEAAVAGVSVVTHYDPLGRPVAALHPDHSYEKLLIDAWQRWSWDRNDTVVLDPAQPLAELTADPDVGQWIARLPAADYSPSWYAARIGGALGPAQRRAARITRLHARTPSRACLDPLGRTVLTVATNRAAAPGGGVPVTTAHRVHLVLDIRGRTLAVADCLDGAPDRLDDTRDRDIVRYAYDLSGARILVASMEAGARRVLADPQGAPCEVWESMDAPATDRRFSTQYDRLRRPVVVRLSGGPPGTAGPAGTAAIERVTYGEGAPQAALSNLRAQPWQVRDQAGLLTQAFDVQGNPSFVQRRFAAGYRGVVDWSGADALEPEAWTTRTTFDALGRPLLELLADGSTVRRAYDASGLLASVTVWSPGDAAGTASLSALRYNARGQRIAAIHGNGVTTTYTYEPDTFRLAGIITRRGPGFNDAGQAGDLRREVQNIGYVYDPMGNVTHIQDDAQPRVFMLDTAVDASARYTYDALYRLVGAEGREHLGLAAGGGLRRPVPQSATDAPRADPPDRNALGRYRERYTYDTAGNLARVVHRGMAPRVPGWTRDLSYDERSQLQPDRADLHSNRLSASVVGSGQPEAYRYDERGSMTGLPPLQLLRWDERDQLAATSLQSRRSGVPETTHYAYDQFRERARKVTDGEAAEGVTPARISERLYLGALEIYRTFDANGQPALVRTTVHLMDGTRRVALVELRISGADASDARLVRYQYANHLGSAMVELDAAAMPVSYEEYYPYGGTALLIRRNGVLPKRYRYSARERDEESGLGYHGARYYAPWLGRWTAADPLGVAVAPNCYDAFRGNPVRLVDPDGRAPLPHNFVEFADTVEAGLQRMAQLGMDKGVEYGLAQDPTTGQLMILQGGSKSVDFGKPGELIPLGHSHTGLDDTSSPSTDDLNLLSERNVAEHWIFGREDGWARLSWNKAVRAFELIRNVGGRSVRSIVAQNPTWNPADESPIGRASRWVTVPVEDLGPATTGPAAAGAGSGGRGTGPEPPVRGAEPPGAVRSGGAGGEPTGRGSAWEPPASLRTRTATFADVATPAVAKALLVAGLAYAIYDTATKTARTTQEKGPLMGTAQAGKTAAKHATAMLWFAVGATVALTIASGGAASPLAAAAIGTAIAAGGTMITQDAIDEATPDLL